MTDPIPVSHLALELPAPAVDWPAYLAGRGIEVSLDDIGRPSVTRAAARELLAEHRENEARKVQLRKESERQAVEADQQWRAQLGGGIPWYVIGNNISPAAAILEAAQDAEYASRPRSVAAELLEAELTGEGNTMVYHSLQPDGDAA